MTYQITREIRIHHNDGWFYQFTDDGEGCIEVSAYETQGIEETKTGQTLHIPKDGIEHFIAVLEELK
jgi:hypothetical protein